jgi:AraC family transcriptional regulator
MEYKIKTVVEKNLVGLRVKMSLTNNSTHQLWSSFMPRRKEIKNSIGSELFSIQVYSDSYDFKKFNPNASFEKWAAVEVTDHNNVPAEMETLMLPRGLYAAFIHQGAANEFTKTFNYIFNEWLPNSNYLLDHRPHFEIMGDKYKGNDSTSEEEVWIPIKSR